MQPPETRYAVRDGISIAYQVVGDGPFDLVFAPGFVSHLDLQWTDPGFARFLTRLASFSRLILFDKPGTGLSDPISSVPTLEERAADLRTVLDAAGSNEAAILAFSEAGPATLMLAATHPQRVSRLVLVGTFAASPQRLTTEEWAEADAELRAWAERATGEITEIVDHWGEGRGMSMFAPSLTGDLQRRFYATFERAAASPRMVRALIQHVFEVDVRDILPLIRQPTLVLHRRGDRVVNVVAGRRLAEEIDGAQFVELEGEDHAFWFGDFDPILDQIERFLTGMNVATRPDRVLATVLFTDIVGSTELAGRLGDSGWRDLLQRHDAMLRRTVEQYGGQVVKHIGDGALSRFDGPAAAVRCAQQLGDDVAPLGIELRAGVHTGECEVIGDDLGGMAVHIGARVQALAPPGTVLVSGTVKDLVVGSEMLFADHGEHELKGVPGTWRIYALTGEQQAAVRPLEAPGVQMGPSDRVVVTLARRAPRAMRVGARLASRRLRTA
jgi:class 3 adenylate cyclase